MQYHGLLHFMGFFSDDSSFFKGFIQFFCNRVIISIPFLFV